MNNTRYITFNVYDYSNMHVPATQPHNKYVTHSYVCECIMQPGWCCWYFRSTTDINAKDDEEKIKKKQTESLCFPIRTVGPRMSRNFGRRRLCLSMSNIRTHTQTQDQTQYIFIFLVALDFIRLRALLQTNMSAKLCCCVTKTILWILDEIGTLFWSWHTISLLA